MKLGTNPTIVTSQEPSATNEVQSPELNINNSQSQPTLLSKRSHRLMSAKDKKQL